MSSLYQIEKLDEKNYGGWKIHMKSILIHSGSWGYVSGTIAKPEAEDGLNEWLKGDEKCLATITLSVTISQLMHIKDCNTSKEAWEKLQNVFQPSGPVRKVT